jgi:hypothetical protein
MLLAVPSLLTSNLKQDGTSISLVSGNFTPTIPDTTVMTAALEAGKTSSENCVPSTDGVMRTGEADEKASSTWASVRRYSSPLMILIIGY